MAIFRHYATTQIRDNSKLEEGDITDDEGVPSVHFFSETMLIYVNKLVDGKITWASNQSVLRLPDNGQRHRHQRRRHSFEARHFRNWAITYASTTAKVFELGDISPKITE